MKENQLAVLDLIKDDMLLVENIPEALQIARALGYEKQFSQYIFVYKSNGWVGLETISGSMPELDKMAEQHPGWERPRDFDEQTVQVDFPGLLHPPENQEGEEWKKNASIRGFTLEAAPWTEKELEVLKTVYRSARDQQIPHNLIYQRLSDFIPHSSRGIKQKLEALYQQDEQLKSYKYESWSRERIISELERVYKSGLPVARKSLPPKLEYQISNHSLPKAITRGFEVFFDSFDHAVSEAILNVGQERDGDDKLDPERAVKTLDQAYRYYRHNEKFNNPWTKDEIVALFRKAHEKGLPLTKSFFTTQAEVYKPLLEVSRNLDGLRRSIEKNGLTWADVVIEAVPDYKTWYDDSGRATTSMGELRVKRFLDLNGIKYRSTTRADKIAVTEPEVLEMGYKNFLPDLFLLDDNGNTIGIVEVYGAIADSGAASGQLAQKYREKIEAKERVYDNLSIPHVSIHDNSLFGSDLSDARLKERFAAFLTPR